MSDLTNTLSIPSTLQELEQAVERYKSSDLSGSELLCLWQAIRDGSLNQFLSQGDQDGVPGEESY
ncbi:hypothetical protein [Microcoleus sp. FACHB-672]|uniref:hypothetical protein n=1 Tax=Microcoleus sp. FACHB-672 TaxID=2692825 RepID=UPI001685C8D0|nr:hypothetical protein [Microcoleus sp. FACHB-672]MBD2040740.1 hypothetical protein [Microcoleus sp. FACHB-672]